MRWRPRGVLCLTGTLLGLCAVSWSGLPGGGEILAALAVQTTGAEQRLAELLQQSRSASTPAQCKALTFDVLKAVGEAVDTNDFPTATRLSALAVQTATKSGNGHALFLAKSRRDDVLFASREYRSVMKHFDTLRDDPDDMEARFEVGRFLALVKGNWEPGLRLLSRGSDPAYRRLAEAELDVPDDRRSQMELASGWLALALQENGLLQIALARRANEWFRQALAGAAEKEREFIRRLMGRLPICFLSDLQESDVKPGPWPLGKGGDVGIGRQIEVNGIPSPQGLGMHPPDSGFASVKFALDGNWKVLASGVAISDAQANVGGPVVFWVLGDGKVLWKSRPLRERGDAEYFQVSVKNVETIELRTQASRSAFGAHAVWLDPTVSQ